MLTQIVRLEDLVDRELPAVRRPPRAQLLTALTRWSDAVWAAAAAEPVPSLADATIAKGLTVARHPVFVCGVHRSGTTLVRDLLDAHPQLTVLPSEGRFFVSFEAKIQSETDGGLSVMGREWLRRLVNPISQPPYWILGRSDTRSSPYVGFARALRTWWQALAMPLGQIRSWPIAGLALAYAADRPYFEIPPRLMKWVDKTPTNEQFLDRIWAEYPDAKVIHVIREPSAVFASGRTLEAQVAGTRRGGHRILRDLDLSYRIAADRQSSAAPDRYQVVRYESLIRDVRDVMTGLATFLEIDLDPILFSPTVGGLPSASNSSFGVKDTPGEIVATRVSAADRLSKWNRDVLGATVGESAAAVGYQLEPVGWLRAQLLKLSRPFVRL